MARNHDLYDLIVLGVGGVGSAALYAAARRGWRVLGIEQFGVAHDRGSSHGQTRIIRAAYYEHPNYVPLAKSAFGEWARIEREAGERLFRAAGLLQVGKRDSELMEGVRRSAREHGLNVDALTAAEIEARWPYFQVTDEYSGLFEPGAGYLRVEQCVAHLTKLAKKAGAELLTNTTVERWLPLDSGAIEVRTSDDEVIRTRRLVVTAGPWSQNFTNSLRLDLQVVRKQQQWFQMDRHEIHEANGGCCFLFDTPQGCFYGFPQIDHLGMKVAEHSGGQATEAAEALKRGIDASDLERCQSFVNEWFRCSKIRLVHHSVCMYTMSPDQHFVIDRWPGLHNVAFAAGLSGHGFKFVPVLGKHLVELVDGQENSEFDFLKLNRFERQSDGTSI
jgi:sarcosine oxidase